MPELSSPLPIRWLAVDPAAPTGDLLAQYRAVRAASEELCAPLNAEDMLLQSMPDASPTKWHLAHTTWFFETFVLEKSLPDYEPFHPQFGWLFNSYYHSVGPRWPRPQRGLLSRPPVGEVFDYREHVDRQMSQLLERVSDLSNDVRSIVVLGLNHEQQHQELMLTDLKHAWSMNPLRPAYCQSVEEEENAPTFQWRHFPAGLTWMGDAGEGFAFDNETPRHRTWIESFALGSRLVTCGEYLRFIEDGGYDRPEFWLSDGWNARQTHGWTAPLYWHPVGDQWEQITLAGALPLRLGQPVCHVSYYEADAFARWCGARLPTEAEWETAAAGAPLAGHFLESGRFHPSIVPAAGDCGPLHQLYGDVWQWTASPYVAYPGYQPTPGALGEYNGKFMCNQIVLRGASCATPRSHARGTYRNFFPPDARWQFSGIRLAKDDAC